MKKIIAKLNNNRHVIVVVGLIIIVIAVMYNARLERNREVEMMTSWMGKHYFELIDEWGPPTDVILEGNGDTIIDYSYYNDLGERAYLCERYFYANSDGTIYNFKWKGS